MEELILQNYKTYRRVKEDRLGEIWEGEHRQTGQKVRIRKLAAFFREDTQFSKRFFHEKTKWMGMHHPALLTLLSMDPYGDNYFLVYEEPVGVSLEDYLVPGRRMSDLQLARVGRQLLGGLDYLEKQDVFHGGISLNSVWYSSESGIKTGDYGLFQLMSPTQRDGYLASMTAEEKRFYAPEMFGTGKMTTGGDLFSLGILLYELTTLRQYPGTFNPSNEKERIPHQLLHLLGRFLQEDPGLRFPNAGEAALSLEQWAQSLQVTRPSMILENLPELETAKPEKKSNLPVFLRNRSLWVFLLILLISFIGIEVFKPFPRKLQKSPPLNLRPLPRVEGEIPRDNGYPQKEDAPSGSEGIEEETLGPAKRETTETLSQEGSLAKPLAERKEPYVTPPLKKSRPGTEEETTPGKNVSTNESLQQETDYGFFEPTANQPPGMIMVQGALVSIGSDNRSANESPRHTVLIPAFYIDRFEVTNTQYEAFIQESGYPAPPSWGSRQAPPGQESYPVTNITWQEAYSYSTWAGKRLPTEEEWERVAQAANADNYYPWGMEFVSGMSNLFDSGVGTLRPIGQYQRDKSRIGCFDVMGNAAEWTASYYQPYSGNTVSDSRYGTAYRVVRGGSYLTKAKDVRISGRFPRNPTLRSGDIGFRCARDITVSRSVVQIPVPRYTFSSRVSPALRAGNLRWALQETP